MIFTRTGRICSSSKKQAKNQNKYQKKTLKKDLIIEVLFSLNRIYRFNPWEKSEVSEAEIER